MSYSQSLHTAPHCWRGERRNKGILFRVKKSEPCRVRSSSPPEQVHPLGNICLLQPGANAADSLSSSSHSCLLSHTSYWWKTMANCWSSLGLGFLFCTMRGPSSLPGWWAEVPQHGGPVSLSLVQSRPSTSRPEIISAAPTSQPTQNLGLSGQHLLEARGLLEAGSGQVPKFTQVLGVEKGFEWVWPGSHMPS